MLIILLFQNHYSLYKLNISGLIRY